MFRVYDGQKSTHYSPSQRTVHDLAGEMKIGHFSSKN
ncbi:hypothetical protein PMI22_01693 [Pseudomonas sp. GM21]|nr:hypothetical protein PMI22_01693 [Pseudomonas sp. GM21]